MLSTKNMSAGSGRIKPVISVGNQVIKINGIKFDKTPYDSEAYNIILNVETEPVKGDFQGFLKDVDNPNGPRYEGQVGRVRFTPYPYKDTVLPSGREINRDQEVLKSMIFLAEVLDKRDELDSIEAVNIFEFMDACNALFSNSEYMNACIAGREWENKDGYINYDLFLPRMSKEGMPLQPLDGSRLLAFDESKHVKRLKKPTVNEFEPSNSINDDFDL
jgi:hypothetical protein